MAVIRITIGQFDSVLESGTITPVLLFIICWAIEANTAVSGITHPFPARMSCSLPSLAYWLSDAGLLVAVAMNRYAQLLCGAPETNENDGASRHNFDKEPSSST